MRVTAIIAAAGRGERVGGSLPKQLHVIGGRVVLERSLAAFVTHPEIDEVIVALPSELAAAPPDFLGVASKPVRIVAGGERRQDSVANAFRAASETSELIVIHDAARPFASARLISRTIAAAAESGAALAAVPARDTVKRIVGAEGPAGTVRYVGETLPREAIALAQTPQAFRRDVLVTALAEGGVDATDEAALAERAGYRVRLVEGEPTNIKITTPEDLPVAEAIARRVDGGGPAVRVGTGYDLHRLVEGRPLILGGITIPFERGLAGHSDGDAVCHAVTDALLGAASAGDIGGHFPDSDARYRGASSIGLLAEAAAIVAAAGFATANVDVVVIAERPKIASFLTPMRSAVAQALGVSIDRVSIKGKTNEQVGELGRGEAIAVHAVALLTER
jgi:2-C-methyl-D-erythritol 4-phosphate cytidylyltransferase/2-C-methyl-D-erythritol 2,4-cyclodiphosphate synthase